MRIEDAIKSIDDLEKNAKKYGKKLCNEIAKIGYQDIKNGFASAVYDEGLTSKNVTVEKVSIPNGYSIVVHGSDAFFIEFGAGVHYNGIEPYPTRPSELSSIGEYGKGKGKNDLWYFKKDGVKYHTHGTPSQPIIHKARRKMRKALKESK